MKKYSKHFFIWMVGITIIFVVAIVIANSLLGGSVEQAFAQFTAQVASQAGKAGVDLTQMHQTALGNLQSDLFIKSTVLLFVLLLLIVIASVRFYLLNKSYERTNLYETILHNIGKPLFATDLHRNVTFMNDDALKMLGKTEDNVLGKQCSSLFNVELCNTGKCAIECLLSGQPSCSFTLDKRNLFTKAFDLTNASGDKIGFIEVITDITEETKLHKELTEKAEWYESILNCVTNPLSVTDMDMRMTFLNNAGLNVLGKTAKDVIGKKCKDVWGVAICSDERCGIECLRNGKGQSVFNVGDLVMTTDAQFLYNKKGDKVGHIEVVGDVTDTHRRLEYTRNAVEKLTGSIKRMADGDLTNIDLTMEQPSQYTQHTYAGFNTIAENLGILKEHLVSLISQLQQAIQTTAASSAEIAFTADSLATATQEQSSQTDDVAAAMEEMSRTVTENAASAARTADVAKQTENVAVSGGQVVEQTVTKMKEIAVVVKTSAENIVKLGESSKRIGEIISVIDDIADQTNLLSLNAAIEAARAGEQGRGFAVVADSVGKLAVSTASATKEIADMIKGIQSDTDLAVKAMEKGTLEVQSGIELADNAGHSIQDILRSINELLGMVEHIAAASEQQSATSEEISNNVSSISKVTADSARNVETVATTAGSLTQMTETLNTLAMQFKIEDNGHHNRRLA